MGNRNRDIRDCNRASYLRIGLLAMIKADIWSTRGLFSTLVRLPKSRSFPPKLKGVICFSVVKGKGVLPRFEVCVEYLLQFLRLAGTGVVMVKVKS